jgi:hypothetical protein
MTIYRQVPHKSPHEVSRTRRVLLGTAAQLYRNISEHTITRQNPICEFQNPCMRALDASIGTNLKQHVLTVYEEVMAVLIMLTIAPSPWVERLSVVSIHTQFYAFPPHRPAQ